MNFIFKTGSYLRFINGQFESGPHAINQAIKVDTNGDGKEGYTLTIHNLDSNHQLQQNNVLLAAGKMEVIEEAADKIVLRGYGHDFFSSSGSEYGLTVMLLQNGLVEKCILHVYDYINRDIEYFKAQE